MRRVAAVRGARPEAMTPFANITATAHATKLSDSAQCARARLEPSRRSVLHCGCRVGDALWIAGNRKREGGARPVIRFYPEPPVMSLDDGAAHGEPDTHA